MGAEVKRHIGQAEPERKIVPTGIPVLSADRTGMS
jgi:hypothetical protein